MWMYNLRVIIGFANALCCQTHRIEVVRFFYGYMYFALNVQHSQWFRGLKKFNIIKQTAYSNDILLVSLFSYYFHGYFVVLCLLFFHI